MQYVTTTTGGNRNSTSQFFQTNKHWDGKAIFVELIPFVAACG